MIIIIPIIIKIVSVIIIIIKFIINNFDSIHLILELCNAIFLFQNSILQFSFYLFILNLHSIHIN